MYPFPNFNGATAEVWEWINNFIPHSTGHLIIYPWCDRIFKRPLKSSEWELLVQPVKKILWKRQFRFSAWRKTDFTGFTASQRAHDAITTSLLRQNDVATSFWRHNDVIITSCVRWDTDLLHVCISFVPYEFEDLLTARDKKNRQHFQILFFIVFWMTFHWNVFPIVQLTSQYWLR